MMMSFAEEKAYCRKFKVIVCTEYLLLVSICKYSKGF